MQSVQARQCLGIGLLQQRRHGTDSQRGRRQHGDVEAERGQNGAVFFGGADFHGVGKKGDGDQQRLHLHGVGIERIFQLLVENAFVRSVHVDQHQAPAVLCQHIDAVQLGQREAKREVVGRQLVGGGAFQSPERGCNIAFGRLRGRCKQRAIIGHVLPHPHPGKLRGERRLLLIAYPVRSSRAGRRRARHRIGIGVSRPGWLVGGGVM